MSDWFPSLDPPTNPNPDTKEHKGISAAEVKDKYDKGLRSLNFEYRQYWMNYAFW